MSTASSPVKRRQGCPICGKSISAEFKPFCSRGCKDRDLLKWLGDSYRVAGPPADDDAQGIGADGLDREG